MYKKLTIREAAAQCRRNHHGSYNYSEGLDVLKKAYARNHPNMLFHLRYNPTLEALWSWVDGYLEMEEASHADTPLG